MSSSRREGARGCVDGAVALRGKMGLLVMLGMGRRGDVMDWVASLNIIPLEGLRFASSSFTSTELAKEELGSRIRARRTSCASVRGSVLGIV